MTRGLDYPAYIRDAAPPDGCCVPPGALPQVVEGHVSVAGVATVGINPHGVWHRSNYPSMKAGGAEQGVGRQASVLREQQVQVFHRPWSRFSTRAARRTAAATLPVSLTWPVLWMSCSGRPIPYGGSWTGGFRTGWSRTACRSLREYCTRAPTSGCCWAMAGRLLSGWNASSGRDSSSGWIGVLGRLCSVANCWAGGLSAGANSCPIHG